MSQGRKKSSPGLRKIEPWNHEEGQEFAGSDLAEHVGSISGISQADAGKPCCWGHVYHVRVLTVGIGAHPGKRQLQRAAAWLVL